MLINHKDASKLQSNSNVWSYMDAKSVNCK